MPGIKQRLKAIIEGAEETEVLEENENLAQNDDIDDEDTSNLADDDVLDESSKEKKRDNDSSDDDDPDDDEEDDDGDESSDENDEEDFEIQAIIEGADFDPEFMAEVNYALLEAEFEDPKQFEKFINENADMLVRDGILTESSYTKSYMVLSPQARRQKAINLMKLRMAREAGDSRYTRAMTARKLYRRLVEQIRNDPRYREAEVLVRRQQFKIVNNPEAMAAAKRAQAVKLGPR